MNNLFLKLLQHFNKKNNNRGFTLIELLVVIIIIGILSAIALPSFLNQANKAKEVEPTLKINNANKMQIDYYYENGEFTRELEYLELPDETKNYEYNANPFPLPQELSIIRAEPKDNQLKNVVGFIYRENDGTFYARVCKVSPTQFPALILLLLQQKWDEADAQYCSGK